MKLLTAIALLVCFASSTMLTSPTFAQSAKPTKKKITKTVQKTSSETTATPRVSSAGAEVSGVTGSASGDPYNLNHPFFNGDARWSHPDTMYAHGDFPWAMVADHPDNFRFNPESGQWEVIGNPSSMGKTTPSR
jgi:hypothetical protein